MKLPLLLGCCLLLPFMALGKNAGDMLEQYLNDPAKAIHEEVLGLVEIIAVDADKVPEGQWKQMGVLRLRTIESIGGKLPATFAVRFRQRGAEGNDAWTWDYTTLAPGKKMLGFFNQWNGAWAVREDGRTHVISNVEKIPPELLRKVQPLFKESLSEQPEKAAAKP